MSEIQNFVSDCLSGKLKEESLELGLAPIGYALGPVAKLLFSFGDIISATEFIGNIIITPIFLKYYKNELNKINENEFIQITIIPGPGSQEAIYKAHNSNSLDSKQIDSGYLVALSQLTESDIKKISEFSGALDIVFLSDIN